MNHESERPLRHPRTASRTFEQEVVIVDPATNMVRMLNTVGSRVWELADGTRTVEQIVQVLTEEFDVEYRQAEQGVMRFLEELRSRGLLASD